MEPAETSEPRPFAIKDCALIALATGRRAQNLRELGMHLHEVSSASIYYHFWGGLLRPRFDDPEYMNDFAAWARHALHDKVLAERLAIIDPTDFQDLEELRRELIDTIEDRIEESEIIPWTKADQQFHFLQSKIVVFDTGIRLDRPEQLVEAIPTLSAGSIFYHLIDARRRDPQSRDDFSLWLRATGEANASLADRVQAIDPYFGSLTELRDQLGRVVGEQLRGS